MTEKETLSLFEKYNALLTGHFKLSSGLHSEKYLQCAIVLQYPGIAEKLAKALAEKFSKTKIDVVAGPALGGITLAYETARALKARGIFTERENGRMILRRGFTINKGEKVIVAEDVVTTGGSTKEVIAAVKNAGGDLIGVISVIDRSDASVDFGARYESLAKIQVKTYAPENCPLCKAGVPLAKPGSRKS